MSLQRFRCHLSKHFRLASALKIVCTIPPIGMAIRGHLTPMIGGPVLLTAGMPANLISIVLCTLASTLLARLNDHSQQCPQNLKQPTSQTLADSLWLSCGYRISARN